MPVNFIKIDGSFIKDALKDKSDLHIINAINQISHSMGKKTIAEFVENEQIKTALIAMGVDYGQGAYLGEPLSLEDIIELSCRKKVKV